MSARSATLVATLVLVGLGAFAAWMVGVPPLVVGVVSGGAVVIALLRARSRKAPPEKAASPPPK